MGPHLQRLSRIGVDMKFNIGDTVWLASCNSEEHYLTCPDCGGTKTVTVTLWNGEVFVIDCVGCSRGYDRPSGSVSVYNRTPSAMQVVVEGVSLSRGKPEYSVKGIYTYHVPEENLFSTEALALVRADELAAKGNAEEKKRVLGKEKPTRTWAWNVHYHRAAIKRANRDITYHTEKLNAALPHSKEEKKKPNEGGK